MTWNLEEASRCHAEGRRCLFLGHAERALEWFNRALLAFPRDDRAMSGRGDAYFALNRYREAAACYEEAERMAQATGPMWNLRAGPAEATARAERAAGNVGGAGPEPTGPARPRRAASA
ncbi:MAG: tetratricopeptide repeat protein [Planctomycetes bacterium]|nr:tetratricopeptide repeat protein [Planctomycetota bacterium]